MCDECEIDLLILAAVFIEVQGIPRDHWVHPFYRNRRENGFENYLAPMILNNEFGKTDHISFHSFFRMTHETFLVVCATLEDRLNTNQSSLRNDTLSVQEKVAVTLRFLATGNSYRSLELLFLISSKTISKIIVEVCDSIIDLMGPQFMKLPATETEWLKIASEFQNKRGLPHCLGALDGKHISELFCFTSLFIFINLANRLSLIFIFIN